MKKIIVFCLVLMVTLVFGCAIAEQDPQANLAIQIVKDSPITRIKGFGQTVEQYFYGY